MKNIIKIVVYVIILSINSNVLCQVPTEVTILMGLGSAALGYVDSEKKDSKLNEIDNKLAHIINELASIHDGLKKMGIKIPEKAVELQTYHNLSGGITHYANSYSSLHNQSDLKRLEMLRTDFYNANYHDIARESISLRKFGSSMFQIVGAAMVVENDFLNWGIDNNIETKKNKFCGYYKYFLEVEKEFKKAKKVKEKLVPRLSTGKSFFYSYAIGPRGNSILRKKYEVVVSFDKNLGYTIERITKVSQGGIGKSQGRRFGNIPRSKNPFVVQTADCINFKDPSLLPYDHNRDLTLKDMEKFIDIVNGCYLRTSKPVRAIDEFIAQAKSFKNLASGWTNSKCK